MLNPRNSNITVCGLTLKKKTYASVVILALLIVNIAIVGFYAKQTIRVRQAEAVYDRLSEQKPEVVVKNATPEQLKIIAYIRERFGNKADEAIKIFNCESHLNPKAWNYNSNKTYDRGVAQINDVHSVPERFLYDWHTNIDIAYKIYQEQGWNPWTCKYVLK